MMMNSVVQHPRYTYAVYWPARKLAVVFAQSYTLSLRGVVGEYALGTKLRQHNLRVLGKWNKQVSVWRADLRSVRTPDAKNVHISQVSATGRY